MSICGPASARQKLTQTPETAALFGQFEAGTFTPIYQSSLGVLLKAEDLYFAGEHGACKALLDELWAEYPLSSQAWREARNPLPEVFTGTPPAYYALRMLSECANWRASGTTPAKPATAVLTVVLVGQSEGIQARIWKDLERNSGERVEHKIATPLLDQDHRILHQSLRLFREYVLAMTAGKLAVETQVLHLANTSALVATTAGGRRHAGLAGGAFASIWQAVPQSTQRETDWWWVIYPSHVPEQHADFKRTEFITGGMGSGPDGASPCFIVDDRWLLRKPPHLGLGKYSDAERRAYLPQWLQHEFFHHLFRSYPEFELEKSGHQWFDRRTWPTDFEGVFEADYYQEALHKRLQTQARVPMHIQLRYAAPPENLCAQITSDQLLGEYRHAPYQNDWHGGVIEIHHSTDSSEEQFTMIWKNKAGVSWRLQPQPTLGRMLTGPENPYFKNSTPASRQFRIVLLRDAAGNFLPEVAGFQFQASFYKKVGS